MVKNLVFSGAGFKCWAYIGTLRALSEYNIKDIEQVVGVSAGGIFGLMYILGAKWDFLLRLFYSSNIPRMEQIIVGSCCYLCYVPK